MREHKLDGANDLLGGLAAGFPAEGEMVILDVVLMALIGAAIVGLLTWSIFTQHRHHGCADLRIRRRLRISVRFVVPDEPVLRDESTVIAA